METRNHGVLFTSNLKRTRHYRTNKAHIGQADRKVVLFFLLLLLVHDVAGWPPAPKETVQKPSLERLQRRLLLLMLNLLLYHQARPAVPSQPEEGSISARDGLLGSRVMSVRSSSHGVDHVRWVCVGVISWEDGKIEFGLDSDGRRRGYSQSRTKMSAPLYGRNIFFRRSGGVCRCCPSSGWYPVPSLNANKRYYVQKAPPTSEELSFFHSMYLPFTLLFIHGSRFSVVRKKTHNYCTCTINELLYRLLYLVFSARSNADLRKFAIFWFALGSAISTDSHSSSIAVLCAKVYQMFSPRRRRCTFMHIPRACYYCHIRPHCFLNLPLTPAEDCSTTAVHTSRHY